MKRIALIIAIAFILGVAISVILSGITDSSTPSSGTSGTGTGSSTPTPTPTPTPSTGTQDLLTQFGVLSAQIIARENGLATGEECETLRRLTNAMRGDTTLNPQRVLAAISLYRTMCE